MYSIAIAIPLAESYAAYIYAVFTVLSMGSLIYMKTFYDPTVTKIHNFN